MSFINYMAREINCKIVYYGPGLCGKTTNLQYIYERTNPGVVNINTSKVVKRSRMRDPFRDFFGDEVGGVEADAKLADQLRCAVLRLLHLRFLGENAAGCGKQTYGND